MLPGEAESVYNESATPIHLHLGSRLRRAPSLTSRQNVTQDVATKLLSIVFEIGWMVVRNLIIGCPNKMSASSKPSSLSFFNMASEGPSAFVFLFRSGEGRS